MQTLDILSKEWFDKNAGNSYFAAVATIDFGLPTEKCVKVPFQYGYGDQYLAETAHQLRCDGLLPDKSYGLPITRYCRENGIVLRYSKQTNCLKRELLNI